MITKQNQVQSAMEELLAEVKVRDWEEADDAQIQEAMNRVRDWESRRLGVGDNFLDYKGMVATCLWTRSASPALNTQT